MSLTSKTLIGAIFLLAGASVLLNIIGIHIGSLISFLFAGLLILIGIRKIQQGSKLFGGGILLFGLLILLGAAHLFFQILFAFLIIFAGFKWLTHSKSHVKDDDYDSDFDREWKKMKHEYEK